MDSDASLFEDEVDFSSVFSSETICLSSDTPLVSDESFYFFKSVLVTEKKCRLEACARLISILREESKKDIRVLEKHLPTIVRFALRCPFVGVAAYFGEFLKEITPELLAVNITVPQCFPSCSLFFPKDALLKMDDQRAEISKIFQESFLRTGRVSHLTQLLAWHPSYYNIHLEAYLHIMQRPGPLNLPTRNYIAMMAAARLKCCYIVQEQERDFLINFGPEEWLEQKNIPSSLKDLKEVNAILAHQPWRLKAEHISKLRKNSGWSIPSLIQALVIMADIRAISSFVLSMGIVSEVEYSNLALQQRNLDCYEQADEEQTADVIDMLLHSDKPRRSGSSGCPTPNNNGVNSPINSCENTPQSKVQLFAALASPTDCDQLSSVESCEWAPLLETRFNTEFPNMTYQDFDTNSPQYEILHSEDFSWDTHGFPLVRRFCPVIAEQLDLCFKCIRNMTYQSFNDQKSINTRPLRMAVWYYVHCLFGILHDDFNYHIINMYVPHQRIKNFIKKAACFPHTITFEDVTNMTLKLLPEEKAHIALLVSEARKQAELLYGLNAVNKYLAL